jgi:hypothetical protein
MPVKNPSAGLKSVGATKGQVKEPLLDHAPVSPLATAPQQSNPGAAGVI